AASLSLDARFEAVLHDEPEAALPSTTADEVEGDVLTPDYTGVGLPGESTSPEDTYNEIARALDAQTTARRYTDADIARAANAHLAAKTFTPAEQMELIEEGQEDGVVAANLDRLQIEGTHYEA